MLLAQMVLNLVDQKVVGAPFHELPARTLHVASSLTRHVSTITGGQVSVCPPISLNQRQCVQSMRTGNILALR
jgi:hypothetical protein